MRPEILYPLFAPLTSVKGIGARFLKLYKNLLEGDKVIDLLWHFPSGLIDRTNHITLKEASSGILATLTVEVISHIYPQTKKSPYKVICRDNFAEITLVFFHAYKDYLQRTLPLGSKCIISGKIDSFGNRWQMSHPDYILPLERQKEMPEKEPVYPLTAGLSGKMLGKSVKQALEKLPALPEWLDLPLMQKEGWKDWKTSMLAIHNPETLADIDENSPFRRRIAYDEFLANQLALAITRASQKKLSGTAIKGNGLIRKTVLESLPFKLTDAQKRVIKEINSDMENPLSMLRLVQGDVGSGKTLVAFFSLLNAVECGYQGAFLVPTDILARQHYTKLKPLADIAGVNIALLTGKDKASEKKTTLKNLAEGKINIIIGTHAIFQNKVEFADLRMVVIDEQHRFGVHQRLNIASKGIKPDVLVMTATPIPRTLALSIYGDMELSEIDEKPAGRQPVNTVIVPASRVEEVISAVKRALASNAKVYWVCPLIEENEQGNLTAAEKRFKDLQEIFGTRVGLIHGQLKAEEKEAVMNSFILGEINILVATTVIEVGVDVPEATIMVVEHAERFGLAQLHQLRGRIGRGKDKSNCILLYSSSLSDNAKARLKIMRETEDGFRIAEEDLKLRGFGEVLGTRQSGMQIFKNADLFSQNELFRIAAKDARYIVETDPKLTSERGKALRILLYLFKEDKDFETFRAG